MTEPKNEASFEESIKNLADIVKRLEEGELTLEQSLQAFEQGVALARAAQARLDAAEARVDELLGVDEQGRASTKPIADRDSDPTRAR